MNIYEKLRWFSNWVLAVPVIFSEAVDVSFPALVLTFPLINYKTLVNKKAPYNLAEYAVQSPILNQLNEVVEMNQMAVR